MPPLVIALGAGLITARQGSDTSLFAVGAGVLEVSHEGVLVLADNAENRLQQRKMGSREAKSWR